jgi:hypothetical protein
MKSKSLAPWLFAFFAALPSLSNGQSGSPPDVSPSTPPGLARQSLGGMLYGAGGMLAGGAVGAGAMSASCAVWGEDCGFAGIGGAFIGGLFGLAGGFPLGVYKFGLDDRHTGSLTWTYLSTALGAAAGFGGTALVTRLDSEDAWFQSALVGLAGAPIGALIGFNATRKARPLVPQVSMLPLGHGGVAGNMAWRF